MDIPAGTLEILLREDGIILPTAGDAEKMIHCFSEGHEDSHPSMAVNVVKGLYRCHGCGTKGDSYTYLIEQRGLSKSDAMDALKGRGWNDERLSAAQETRKAIEGSEKGLPKWTDKTWASLKGRPQIGEHDFRLEDGTLIARLIRYASPDSGKGPKVLPFTPCSKGGWWSSDPLAGNIPPEDRRIIQRPLYRLPELISALEKRPGRQIWIVEGEKCVDAVLSLEGVGADFPPACTTAMFGAVEMFDKNDLTILEGKTVMLMADQDEPGRAKMLKLASHLAGNLGCAVKTFLPPGDAEPRAQGYDVADAIYSGGWPGVLEWVKEVGSPKTYQVKKTINQEHEAAYLAPMNESAHFKTLGLYGLEHVAIQSKATHEIHIIRRTQLLSEGALLIIAPLTFWNERSAGQGFGPTARRTFADSLLRAAEARGHVDVENLMGRGCAKNGSKISYNLGDRVLVQGADGRLTESSDIGKAEGLFQPGRPIQVQDNPRAAEFAKDLYDAVMDYRWLAPVDGRAFLGWIVSSIIGGGLPFRPMLWLLAPATSGKTYLLTEILAPVLRSLILPLGSTTEAGLVTAMSGDSMPCYLDEFEPAKGQEHRWESILSLVRMATSGEGARLRGTVGNAATVMHRPRFSMLVASVHRPTLTTADDSRFFTVRFSAKMVHNWPQVRRAIESATDPDKTLAIRSHIIRHAPQILERALDIEDNLLTASQGLSTREAMIIAALTAGAEFLSGDGTHVRRRQGVRDDTYTIFNRLLSSLVRTHEGPELTLAEILRKGWWDDTSGMFIPGGINQDYVKLAGRYGFKMATQDTMYVGTDLEAQNNLLRRSEFANVDLSDYFRRLPGVQRLETHKGGVRKMRFADVQRVTLLVSPDAVVAAGFAVTSETEVEEAAAPGQEEPMPF